MSLQGGSEAWPPGPAVRPAAFTEAAPGVRTPAPQPLNIPDAIPSSEVPPIQLPPQRPDVAAAQRRSEIESLFAEFVIVAPAVAPMPVNGQPPLCLAQLQAMALARSPLIRQAAADVIPWCAARGTGVIVYSPMQSGLLTDSFSAERIANLAEDDWRRHNAEFQEPNLSRNLKLRDALRPIAFARQALHAYRLAFRHPADDRAVRFESPIPADVEALLVRLRQG